MAQPGSAVWNDDGPTSEVVGCEASSDALLLSLCLQDQVHLFTETPGMNFTLDWLIHLLCRYLNRLKEDEDVCAEALQQAQIFLFHRLSPLLQSSERGTFRAVPLMYSGTEPVKNHNSRVKCQQSHAEVLVANPQAQWTRNLL